jgi:hypothetical protein
MGVLEPGGKSGFSPSGIGGLSGALVDLDELPALPDLTIPFLGGMKR